MEAFLVISMFLVVAGSIVITFAAIIQIISNDFKESKGLWIMISMIAFIGPILWLTKGRKLIVKHTPEERLKVKNSFSARSHYSELLKASLLIKLLMIIAVGMILSGYLVRALDLYFFWESKAIGYIVLLIAFVILLWHDIQARKAKKIKRIWSSIGFGLICFILLVKGVMMAILPVSDAYAAAKKQLTNNVELTSEIGEVTGFSVLPGGSLQSTSDAGGTFESASLQLIIKGTNKYLERTVFLEKTPQKDWEIISLQK